MVKNWFAYLLGLGGTVVFHIYYFGWYSWFLLVLALVLPWFSLIISLMSMLRTRLKLEAPPAVSCGEAAYVTVTAFSGFLPQSHLRFRLTVTAAMSGKKTVLRQRVQNQGSYYVPLDTGHCGSYLCRVEKPRVYDYLGLFWIPVRRSEAVKTLVRPVPQAPAKLPNLSQFLLRRLKPKPGGGFSEEHELRDYRPGDNLRDIHWKLSVKTDRLIVREAQEPVRGLTLLTFDLRGDEETVDSTLSQLVWLSQWLCDHDTPHQILWLDPADCHLAGAAVETPEALEQLIDRLLETSLREDTPSLEGRSFPRATWRCHVVPGEEVKP